MHSWGGGISFLESVVSLPVDWWRTENVRKTGLMCLGGGAVGWGEWGWVSGNFFGVSGKFLGISRNFPGIVDVSGVFKMILCDDKIKF